MANRIKICCHCGLYTKPQLQDFNRDTGYGYCDGCLEEFYEPMREAFFGIVRIEIRECKKGLWYLVDFFKEGQWYQRSLICELEAMMMQLKKKYILMEVL